MFEIKKEYPSEEFPCLVKGSLSVLEETILNSLKKLMIFPQYFDVSAASALLGLEHDQTYDLISEMSHAGFLFQEPDISLYARFYIHPSIKPVLDGQPSEEDIANFTAHFQLVLRSCTYLYFKGGDFSRLGLELFDKEYVNIKKAIDLVLERKDFQTAIDFLMEGRRLISKRIDPSVVLRWWEQVHPFSKSKSRLYLQVVLIEMCSARIKIGQPGQSLQDLKTLSKPVSKYSPLLLLSKSNELIPLLFFFFFPYKNNRMQQFPMPSCVSCFLQ
jgi:hypothetical protein